MSETISYANEARKQVGKYLVEQCGYAKRTATRFYKNGDEILSYCYFEKSRGITQVEIGVSPLYMPNSLWILNGRRMEELPFLLESASETQAEAWAESAIRCLKSGNLAFVESLCSPQKLLNYLCNTTALERHFIKPQSQADELIAYSAAYVGDIAFAVSWIEAAKQEIRTERIDALPQMLAEMDERIAKLRIASTSTKPWNRKDIDVQISKYEEEKRLKMGDAQENAPRMIQLYDEWITPFRAPDFHREEYFTQIVAQNKKEVRYEKMFLTK